ncbi:hypothetical protein D3C78_1771330 [compost metagenome]
MHLAGKTERLPVPLIHALMHLCADFTGIAAQPPLGLLLHLLNLRTQRFAQHRELATHTGEELLLILPHLTEAIAGFASSLLESLRPLQQRPL